MVECAVESHAEIVLGSDKKLIRVLHVDDEPALLRVTKQCLELEGMFQVDSVSSVEEALAKLQKEQYDAVVSDYQMPGKDGLEFLEMLRKNGNNSPFILFTGKGREEVAVKALNLGADQYLNKAGDPETVYRELEHAIRKTVEQKKAERALETCGERYRKLFESAVEGILINGSDGRISSLNPAAANILGYNSPKELIGKPATELYADPDSRVHLLQELMEKGHIKERELTWKRKDGTLVEILASVTLQKDEKGDLLRTEGIIKDISGRKRSERLLRESEEKYRKLFDEAIDAIFVADAETGILIDCNRAASELVGREKSELIGKHQRILHPPEETKGEFHESFKQHLKEKEGQILETQVVTKNGEIKYVAIKGNLFELQGKKMLQEIFRDITERKKSEELLTESEERFRDLFESIQDPVGIFVGREGRLIDYNAAFKKSSGYTDKELKGKTFLDFVHPDDHAMVLKKYRTEYSEDEFPLIYEIRGVNKKGEAIPLELSVSTYKKKGKIIGIEIIHRDLTERKKTEIYLKESQRRFEGLFMGNPEAAAYLDQDFRIRDINPRFEELFGYSIADVQDKQINDVVVPDDRREEGETLDKEAKKGYVYHNTVRRKKDKSLVQVAVSAAPITVGDKIAGLSRFTMTFLT